jgi:glutathione S-transferase
LTGKLKVLDDLLSKNAYFGGDTWDMADFIVASVLYTLVPLKYELSKYPRFDSWLKASIERPAAREARKLRE